MLLGAFAFSGMATLTHALGRWCDWHVIATARTALALLFASLLTMQAGAQFAVLRPRALWVRSIAGSVSLVCTFYALPRLPVADVLTLTNVFPIWVAVLSWPLLGEAPGKGAWAAIAVGIVGVVLVAQPHLAADATFPALVALTSSFSTSISMLGLHRLQYIDPRAIVAHFSAVSLVVCLGLLLFVPSRASGNEFDVTSLSMLLGVGACATIGQIFLTKAFAAGPPAKVSVVALTQVAFAMLFDWLVEGHTFSAVSLLGIVLVMAPTAWLLISQGRQQTDEL